MARRTFRGGVHPVGHKELAKDAAFEVFLPKQQMVYPLGQHIGRPAAPVVKKGSRVLAGELIAEASAFVSANIVSACSGTVKGIEKYMSIGGSAVDAVVIENDGLYETAEGIGEKVDPAALTNEQILEKIKSAGIIGMGGAGFPTHVKLAPKKPDDIKYVIANGAECEPYITCDDRLMQEKPDEIMDGLELLLRLFPNAKGVVVIEDNKPQAISAMRKAAEGRDRIRIQVCPVKYPQGGERSCISVVAGIEYKITQLPADSPQLYRDVAKEFPFIAQDYAALDFDASTCPSLASFYAAMSAVKGATVTISGVPQLRSKESDRLAVMAEICNALGQKTTLKKDGLHIDGTGKPEYPEDLKINCHRDPWIFMSMALASAKLTKPIILDNEYCPEKIYRNFLKDFAALGGKYEIL